MEWLEDVIAMIPDIFIIFVIILGLLSLYVSYINNSRALDKHRYALELCENIIYSNDFEIRDCNFRFANHPYNVYVKVENLESGGEFCQYGSPGPYQVTLSLPTLIHLSDTNTPIGLVTCQVG